MLLTRDMPIYEYSCSKCGETIERIQKFSDPPLKKHPGCGGKLTKLISQSAFQLKGSGWYVTDYARASGQGGEKGSEASGSEASGSEAKASESAPGESAKKPAKDKKDGSAEKPAPK